MRKPTDEPRPVQIGVRVPAKLGDQLAAIAERENNGVSAVVRRLLAEALQREQGTRDAA
jgi:hypothetical protein